jgi:VanZ family protein
MIVELPAVLKDHICRQSLYYQGMMLRFLRAWWPAFAMIAAIFMFSSIPSSQMPVFGGWDVIVKKGGHMLGYGLLTVAFWRGFEWKKRLFWLPFVLAVLYASTDEFHQSFVPGRHSSPVDVGIDAIGSAILLSLWAWARTARASAHSTD